MIKIRSLSSKSGERGYSIKDMQPDIPEEYLAMAALLGESSRIDSMLIEKPVGLATDTNTMKRSIDQYRQEDRAKSLPPQAYQHPQHVPTIPQAPQYIPQPQYIPPPKVDDGQLEFNLEPSKLDEIIILLKEISVKLTNQNSMLEKKYAIESKKEGVQSPIIKLGKGQ